MKNVQNIWIILLAIALAGCEIASGPDDEDFKKELMQEPAHNFSYYDDFFDPSSSLVDRIRTEDQFVLEYLMDFDNKDNYSFYEPTEKQKELLDEYFKLLPLKYQEKLSERLLAIYFVNDYVASGMTDYVLEKNSDDIYTILIFNSALIDHPMDSWITKKENTCFIDDDESIDIEIDIDSEYTGLLYILIHECTHVMDYTTEITPYTEPDIGKLKNTMDNTSPFTEGVWTDYRNPQGENDFFLRDKISFYGFKNGPLLSEEFAIDIYTNLMKSKFVSLYGSTNWAEDLAEYMTYYHLTQKLGLEYSITVYFDDSLVFRYAPFNNDDILSRIDDLPDFY